MLIDTIRFVICHPLSRRGGAAAALWRFVRWQIVSRLKRGRILHEWVGGARLMIARGMTGATGNIYVGLHEFEEMAFVVHLLREGDLFVDVGANVGCYSVLAGKAAGANVVAFEPLAAAFSTLCENITVNDLNANAELHNVGVGATSGRLRFTANLDTVNHVVFDESEEAVDTPVVTLDSALRTRLPVVIKIDVEGFEQEVLAGARGVLSAESLLAVVMELNGSGARYGFDERGIDHQMLALGFHRCRYAPFRRELVLVARATEGKGNVIYVRKRDEVDRRLRTARTIEVLGQQI